jgi:hypothetical protein
MPIENPPLLNTTPPVTASPTSAATTDAAADFQKKLASAVNLSEPLAPGTVRNALGGISPAPSLTGGFGNPVADLLKVNQNVGLQNINIALQQRNISENLSRQVLTDSHLRTFGR